MSCCFGVIIYNNSGLCDDSPGSSTNLTLQRIVKLAYHGQQWTGAESDACDYVVITAPHLLTRHSAKNIELLDARVMNEVTKKRFSSLPSAE